MRKVSTTQRILEAGAAISVTVFVCTTCLVWMVGRLEGKLITTPAKCAEIVAVSPIFNHESVVADNAQAAAAKGKRK